MFLDAEEQKLTQILHSLKDAMAVDAVVWGFKNSMQLISLWPHHFSPRFPAGLFMTYPDICLVGLQSGTISDLFLYVHLSVLFLLLKVTLKMSRRTVKSSGVKHSLWVCTERSEHRRVKDRIFCNPSFINLSSTKYIAFWGRKDINRNIAVFQWWI